MSFRDSDGPCLGDLTATYKIREEWRRQISTHTGADSFADVSSSNGAYHALEALKASGITGGCAVSPARYCPGQPVTRGQMALFFARALGLHWGGIP